MKDSTIKINRSTSSKVVPKTKDIAQYQLEKFFYEKKRQEKEINKLNTSGNNRTLIEKGKQDRFIGLSLEGSHYNIEGIVKKYDLISYHYGYTTLANRTLSAGILAGKYTEDSLRMIGYNDAQDENIVFEELPESIRECIEYLKGYKLGIEKTKSKKTK